MKWLIGLIGAAVLTQTTVNLVRPVTTYKLIELDSGPVTIGAVAAVFGILPLVAALPVGRYVQHAPRVQAVLNFGIVLIAVGSAAVGAATAVPGVIVGTAALGLGALLFTITGQTMIARFCADRDLDRGFGWFEAGFAAGQMLGPLLVAALLGPSGPLGPGVTATLWVGVAVAIPAIVLTPLMLRHGEPHAGERTGHVLPSPRIAEVLRRPTVMSNVLTSMAIVAALDILAAYLPLLGTNLGVSPAVVGVLLSVRAGATIAARLLLPVLLQRTSRETLVAVGLWGSAATLVPLPWVLQTTWLALVTLAIAGFSLGLGQPLTMALVAQAVPTDWRASALAVRLVANRTGQVVAPLVAGILAAPLGAPAAIWLAGVVLVLSGVERLGHRPERQSE